MFSLAENNIHCRYFQQIEPVHKHAFVKTGEPQHHCRICQRSFQANYRDNAHKQDVKKLFLNGSGISDTVRTTESGHKHRYQNLKKLLTKQVINIGFITTDDWGSYEHEVPPEIHL